MIHTYEKKLKQLLAVGLKSHEIHTGEYEKKKRTQERTKAMARETIKMYNLFLHDFDMVGIQSG